MRVSAAAALALASAGLGACASDGGAAAERARPSAPQVRALISADALVFATFDTDGDLRVSTAELEAGIQREFARADANHDGVLQPLEFQAWENAALGGGNLPPYRLDFDRNVDNVITQDEFHTELVARAHAYDANEDGVLTRDEFVRTINQARAPMERPHMRGGMGGEGGRRGPPGGGG